MTGPTLSICSLKNQKSVLDWMVKVSVSKVRMLLSRCFKCICRLYDLKMRLVAAAVLFIFDFQYHEPIKAKLLICWKTRKQTNQPNNLSDTNFRLVVVHILMHILQSKTLLQFNMGSLMFYQQQQRQNLFTQLPKDDK